MTYQADTISPQRAFLEYLAVLLIIIIPISVQAGIFGGPDTAEAKDTSLSTIATSNSAVDVPVLSAQQNPNPQGAFGGAEVLVNEDALVSSGPVGASTKASSGEISVYTVRSGDTLSHIAEMYGVTSNTILWANDLPRATSIREGQTLIILPIAGVRHTVVKGDTINSLAKKYDGDAEEIISYNELSADDGLVVGSIIVIPGGAIHSAPAATAQPVRTSGSTSVSGGGWLSHPALGAVKTQGIHGYNAVDVAAWKFNSSSRKWRSYCFKELRLERRLRTIHRN